MNIKLPFKITFWKVVLVLTWIFGIIATIVRFTQGLGASTNLSNHTPWGIWIGFDLLCGVGLAAGGFTIAAIVYVFHLKRFYPILRPTILTAFLGYILVVVALMFDLGQPHRIWHLMVYWNHHSVLFEVGWCVMLYNTVLFLEFLPIIFERFGWGKPKKWLKKVTVPIVIAGVVLSTLHQSSLGSLYLIMPGKLYPFWYSAALPFFFIISAVAVGCAMVIFESHLSMRAFGHKLKLDILVDIGRVMMVTLIVYMILKIQVFTAQDVWPYLLEMRTETYLFVLEFLIGVIIPIILLSIKRIRITTRGLYYASLFTITGFLLNRVNITITGMEAASGVKYVPSWMEIAVTVAIVSTGFFVFALAIRYLPIFEHHTEEQESESYKGVLEDELSTDKGLNVPLTSDVT